MARRHSKRRRNNPFAMNEDVNPMNYLGNLSDAMLVLAVGMMLAVILAWKLNISDIAEGNTGSAAQEAAEEVQAVEESELTELSGDSETLENSESEDAKTLEEYGLEEYGKVYRDSEGNLYVVEED